MKIYPSSHNKSKEYSNKGEENSSQNHDSRANNNNNGNHRNSITSTANNENTDEHNTPNIPHKENQDLRLSNYIYRTSYIYIYIYISRLRYLKYQFVHKKY